MGAPDLGLKGSLEALWLTSRALGNNPLGDPALRPQLVYLPPSYQHERARTYPTIYALHGASVDVTSWLYSPEGSAGPIQVIDEAISAGAPETIVVFVDGWTSLGGSQYLDSAGTGNYQKYIYDDVVPAVEAAYRAAPSPRARGLLGHSSGGFGAWHLALTRAGFFTSLAMISADCLFEGVALATVGPAMRRLRQAHDQSFDLMWEHRNTQSRVHGHENNSGADTWWRASALVTATDPDAPCLDQYMLAACYSPSGRGHPTVLFDPRTGELRPSVWLRWLAYDPVRTVPANVDALRALTCTHLAAGSSDPFFADNGAVALASSLRQIQARFTLNIDDEGHGLGGRIHGQYQALAHDLRP